MPVPVAQRIGRLAYPIIVGSALLAAAWSHSVQGQLPPRRQSKELIGPFIPYFPYFSYEATP